MGAIYKREMRAYFTSFIAYSFLAAFVAIEGFMFYVLYSNGNVNVPAIPFAYPLTLNLFLVPVLTMRTISEDKRLKVDQVLLTSPVSVTSIILGKFFACLTVFAIGYSPMFVFELIVAYHASVNWMLFFYSLFGTMLLGAALIAIGIFISSLTESTALAATLSIVVNVLLMFISSIAEMIGAKWFTSLAKHIAMIDRFAAFGEGVLSIPDIVYFASITAVFIFLCVRSVERRRWA